MPRVRTSTVHQLKIGLEGTAPPLWRRIEIPSAAEDIGGIWGLEEIAYLVTHPQVDPPEHFEDLVSQLRKEEFDPSLEVASS